MDLLDEARELALTQIAEYQLKIAQYYDKRVKPRAFKQGDVLKEAEASDPLHTSKPMPRWEGPYRVHNVVRHGTYQLTRLDGTHFNNTWHISRLRKYYH